MSDEYKKIESNHLVFTTFLQSPKTVQLKNIPKASINFYWLLFQSEIRIRGDIKIISDSEADKIFKDQDRWLHEMVWATQQNQPIINPALTEEKYALVRNNFKNKEIPRPDFWGGFRLIPLSFEFRYKNRIRYIKNGDK